MSEISMLASTPPAAAKQVALPFDFPALKVAAEQRFGLTAQATSLAVQGLYERGLITYPFGEGRHLPECLFEDYSKLVQSHKMAAPASGYDPRSRSEAWNTAKVGAHHAIMPTLVPAAALFGLSWPEDQMQVYTLVHDQFLSLFRPS